MTDSDFQFALRVQKQYEQEVLATTPTRRDHEFAVQLQQQFEHEASSENPSSLVYDTKSRSTTKDTTKSLIDPSWEIIDPTPDIHVLFVAFNERFFWNKLLTVCVSWSKRMTSCAGICSYQGRGGMCSITLSEPLLKLRPRKDLVETLLHEMIHAFLFVTDNNRDRDGHGPEFHKHMYRINQEAGTRITVYHSFHEEVRLYQQHWWRCNGPCQYRQPYFGIVRRATNRAPGPNDFWWGEHARMCGGEFVKIKEPEKKKISSSKKENKKKIVSSKGNAIVSYFPVLKDKKNVNTAAGSSNIHGFDSKGNVMEINNNGVKRNSSGTIVVTKTKNMSGYSQSSPTNTTKNVVGGASETDEYSAVRRHWLDKFSNKKRSVEEIAQSMDKHDGNSNKKPRLDEQTLQNKQAKPAMAVCPVCSENQEINGMNVHLDRCLEKRSTEECVSCGKFFDKSELQQHVSECLSASFSDDFERDCPVCKDKIPETVFDSHVEKCLHTMYDDIERRNSRETSDDVIIIEEEDSVRHEFESSLTDESLKKYNCPFCFKMFLKEDMSAHLSDCVRNHVDELDC